MRRHLPNILLPAFFLVSLSSAAASEFRVVPSIAVSEEVNDNILQARVGERLELVTRAQPGAALRYLGPHTSLDASYNLDYRYYARNTREDEFNHAASLRGMLALWDDFFTLEASESYSRVPLDLARDTVQESVLVNQTDQNVATISPFLTWRLGGNGTLRTGYRFSDIRYWHSPAIDKQVHGAFADYRHRLGARLDFDAGYHFSSTETALNRFQKHDVSTGFRYQYGERSFLYGSIGQSWLEFSNGLNSSDPFWKVGVTDDFGLAVATLESVVQYTEDPLTLSTRQTDYSFKLDRALERGRLWLSTGYTEYRVTLDSSQDRKRFQLNLGGSHELQRGVSASISATGERLSRSSSTSTSSLNLPYRLVASASVNWAMAEGTTLGGTYSHISYREEPGESAGSIEVNRGIVELRKSF
ncbi:MAG: hypothetical protein A2075_19005 [Geobacteraceae bacterium GWC2_58_44]|nr:MAG: hypothetical protein A2075_19005 [Geobacteraceae bacterium GWC2_58_44]HBG07898.1 TIGR03016 family PEP-CTERM system-associated outer membrane protein [Geobacter sp.]